MLTLRSSSLALAAVLVLSSACVSHEAERARTPELRAETAPAPRAPRITLVEPDYVEGLTPPATPPTVAEERPSAPSAAHVWVAGHHTRRDGRWVWVAGRHELPPRAGLVWVPGHWVEHRAGHVWIEGGWR